VPRVLRRDGRLLREAGERREAEGNDEERKPAGHGWCITERDPDFKWRRNQRATISRGSSLSHFVNVEYRRC
jgi:hypothetical protein